MRGDEVLGGRTKAVAPGRPGDGFRPSVRERGVELLRATMGLAGALRAAHEPPSCLLRTVASMQHPRDSEALKMATPPANTAPASQASVSSSSVTARKRGTGANAMREGSEATAGAARGK